MRYNVSNIVLIMLCFAAWSAQAQSYRMLHYAMPDGLPGNTVYDIYRDPAGFLWFATDKGIARFDGIGFTNFTTSDGLPDNEVFLLQADWYGRMWIGTCNGHLGYYRNGMFYSERNVPALRFPFKATMINQIQQEKDSSLTVFFRAGTHFVNISDTQYRFYPLAAANKRHPGEEIQTIRKLTAGRYKIVYTLHTLVVDTAMHLLLDQPNKSAVIYTKKNMEGSYLINDTLYSENFTPLADAGFCRRTDSRLNAVFKDGGTCFVATSAGVLINGTEPLLQGISVACVNKDNEGNYWLGTLGSGLYVLDRDFRHTGYFTGQYKGAVRYARADNRYLYVCTQNKSLFRSNKGQTECLFDARKYVSLKSELLKNAYLIDSNRCYALGNNESYVTDNLDGPHPHTARFPVKITYANEILPAGAYYYLFSTEDVVRIARSHPEKDTLYTLPHILTHGDLIYGKAIAPDGSVWFSSGNNVYSIHGTQPVMQQQLGNLAFRVFGIYGHYLVGYTHNNTLVVCNHFDGRAAIDSVKNAGCVWDRLYRLDSNHILISTNNRYRILSLYPSDGRPVFSVQVVEDPFIPLYAAYVCSDGHNCYFLNDGNVTYLPLTYLYRQRPAPAAVFAAVKTADAQYETDSCIVLSFPEAKYVSLSLAAPALKTKASFEYSVSNGQDTDNWRPVNGENISLYNLGYGANTIKARARTNAPMPGTPAVLVVYISRPFWATWWFIALCIILVALGVWRVTRYSIRRTVQKKEQAHNQQIKFLRSEYRSLNALMNPHFIFNALNSVQWLVNSGDKPTANEYLYVFSELVRQNMHNLSKERITLQQEINLVINYLRLEKLRFKEALRYDLFIGEDVETEDILVPPLLLQPLVENALRHGFFNRQSHDNHVWISIQETAAGIQIQVTDNGVGLHQHAHSDGHDSYGLQNIQKRIDQLAQIHNTTIALQVNDRSAADNSVTGTEVTILLGI